VGEAAVRIEPLTKADNASAVDLAVRVPQLCMQGDHMIVSVFVRRLKPGATFQDFVREWEADEGFGVPTRVFNAQSLTDPREIISIGFVAVGAEQVTQWLSTAPAAEAARHERIDTVIEWTTRRSMYELRTEHDFSHLPQQISMGSARRARRGAGS
jgi:hypothetical protein